MLQAIPSPSSRSALPHALQAEMACLGSVMIAPRALDELSGLAVDDFFLPAHREVLEAMRAVAARGRSPGDPIELEEELKARGMLGRLEGGGSYLLTLANAVPTAELARHYATIVSSKAMLRRLIAACAEIQSAAYSGEAQDAGEVVAEARAKIAAIEVTGMGGPTRLSDDLNHSIEVIEGRGDAPEKYLVQSGIGSLDNVIGGFRTNQLVVIAANPGRGKTALAWNIAIRAARSAIPVLVFSLEMSKQELCERALVYEGRVNGRAVVQGRMSAEEWRRIEDARVRLSTALLWVDARKLTAQRICSEARRWRARQRSERALVVIDYLGLVRNEQQGENRNREVGEMSRAFKLLAGEDQANAPVLLCAQLNRENMKGGKDGKPRRPMPSDLRDSGEIEQDADMIIFPWWDGEPPLTGRHPAQLIVGKHRNGPRGEPDVDWEPEFMTFCDREWNDDKAAATTQLEM
jgi:replicative DNA helicase